MCLAKDKILIKLLLTILWTVGFCGALDCIPRDYGYGSIVCVCNSTYCDTVAPPRKLLPNQFLKYTSNKAGLRLLKETGSFKASNTTPGTIYVNPDVEFQEILGWGGAFTDAFGINLNFLEEAARENLLRAYFSSDGIEYSLCRVPIGGTDFSLRGYSYDDKEDTKLANFQLASEDHQYKIPFIKKALNLTDGTLKLFASAWTAPKWMKTNGQFAGFLGFLKKSMYQTWANYFVKFLDHYQVQGIKFWGITTGNEPSLAFAPGNKINNVGWWPSDMATWITENLGPTIRNSSHRDIKLMMLDDQRFFLPWYPSKILQNSTTRQYIDGIAYHWYWNKFTPTSWLAETHERFPEKFILGSEACVGTTSTKEVPLGLWDQGEEYANDIIKDLNHWVSGWVDWNMALDLTGGPTYIGNFVNAPVIVNSTGGEFYKNPMYYTLGHFSKFIPRHSKRVFSNSTLDSNILNVALRRPDNSTVIMILNRNDNPVQISVIDKSTKVAEVTLSARSITTLMYW